MKKFLAKNWFMLGMPVAVALAWVLPEAGADGGWLKAEVTTKLAVAVVFLVQGITLPAQALKDGASQGRLHVGVQLFCFLVIPLVGLALDQIVGGMMAPDLRLGFLFLCVLPSTIVMAVVLATVAGGNVAAAIFNAVLSNVLGVFLTPIWIAAILASGGGNNDQSVGEVLRQVSLLLLVPLAIGQALRRVGLKAWADQHKKRLSNFSNLTILLIVYAAFCNSVQANIWSQHGWLTIGIAGIGVVVLMALALGLAIGAAKLLRLAPPEGIVMVISGAQKSLATGVPLAKVIFGTHPGLGLILLPIMIYHPLQLFICGWLAARHAKHQ